MGVETVEEGSEVNTCFFCGNPSTFFTCVDCGRSAATAARRLLEGINEAAENDILNGNPITGAHHRALTRKLKELDHVTK